MTVSQRGSAVILAAAAGLTPSVQGTWPTGFTETAGDLLIAVVCAYGNTTRISMPDPAGSLQVIDNTQTTPGGQATAIYAKVAAGGTPRPPSPRR